MKGREFFSRPSACVKAVRANLSFRGDCFLMDKMKTYIGKSEFWTYSIGALGQGMVYGIMSSYISDFYVNVLRVGPLFVLFLMLFARIWDAINDPIMGMLADRANPKRGKYKTYLLITPVPIAILTVALFYAPNISPANKMIYASFTYVLWGMIYTMSDVPFWGLPNVMTPNPTERGKLISIARTTNGVGSAFPMVLFMILGPLLEKTGREGIELEKIRYIVIGLTASVIGNILFSSVYFKANERVKIPRPEKREAGEPGSLKLIFKCKPLMLVVLMGVLSAGRYMYQAAAVHVARYSFSIADSPQTNISTVQLVFSVATAGGMFGAMLLMPKLMKRFSYKQLLIASCIIGGAASVIMYLIGYNNFWACVPFLAISCIPCGVINVVSYAMICDALDYMELKSGRRESGLGSACQSFVNKLGNAVATSFIVLMYIIVKLDLNTIGDGSVTPNLLAMSHTIRQGMFSLVSIIPAVSLLVCMIPIFFYDLTGEKKDRVTRELQQQREAKGIVIE